MEHRRTVHKTICSTPSSKISHKWDNSSVYTGIHFSSNSEVRFHFLENMVTLLDDLNYVEGLYYAKETLENLVSLNWWKHPQTFLKC